MPTTLATPGFKDVQWLADRPRGRGQIVSCYVDLSMTAAVRPLWREFLKGEVTRLDGLIGDDEEARAAVHRNIAAIEDVVAGRDPATKGMAIFADVDHDLVQGYALLVPVASRVVVDEEPFLVPLLELLNRQRRYLVVHTDTHRGVLYTAVPGAVRPIEELGENVPKHHRASGELWGKEQATIDRHRKDHVLHYVKELVHEIERAWPEEHYDGIVLFGEHEVTEHVRAALPEHLAGRVVHTAPHAWVGHQESLGDKLAAIHAAQLQEENGRLLADIERRLAEEHKIAIGPQEVIEALRNSQVGFPGCVVMQPDRGETAWQCAGCTSVFAHEVDDCPFCGTRCAKTNLWQAIALLASRHDVPVHVIDEGLERYDGVAALLARDDPWASHEERPATVTGEAR